MLPDLGKDLKIPEYSWQWVLSAFALSSVSCFIITPYSRLIVTLQKSCLLLFCGRLADIHGRKLVFLIGIAWLGIFALGCGFARTASELLVLRGLQGIGSAAAVPSSVRVLI